MQIGQVVRFSFQSSELGHGWSYPAFVAGIERSEDGSVLACVLEVPLGGGFRELYRIEGGLPEQALETPKELRA